MECGARGWLVPAITKVGIIVCALDCAFWRAFLGNLSCFGVDVPNQPMREQTNGRVRVIDDQDETLGILGCSLDAKRWINVPALAAEFRWDVATFLKSRTCDLHFSSSRGKRSSCRHCNRKCPSNNSFLHYWIFFLNLVTSLIILTLSFRS